MIRKPATEGGGTLTGTRIISKMLKTGSVSDRVCLSHCRGDC